MAAVAKRPDGFLDERVEISRNRVEMRHPGEGGKFSDQALEMLHLADDGSRAFLEELDIAVRVGIDVELAPQALRRELDRSERIFDLVGNSPRDLAPRLHPLDLGELAYILQEQHRTKLCASRVTQRARSHHQLALAGSA